MREREIRLPDSIAGEAVEEAVQSAVGRVGASVTLDGTLRSYPGSRHWHLQARGRVGTLEVTYWPSRNRLWVSLHVNRAGDWAGEAFDRLANALQASLPSP